MTYSKKTYHKNKSSNIDVCANKHKGNKNSVRAFKKALPSMPRSRLEVLDCIKHNPGISRHSIALLIGRPLQSVCARVRELLNDFLIKENGSEIGPFRCPVAKLYVEKR